MRFLLAAALLAASLPGAEAGPEPLRVDAAYYQPVLIDGETFPVARSNWYSVIGFTNDWHAPRMRLVAGRWLQVGVHEGIDIAAEAGTPVLAASAGTVEALGWTFYSGNRVGVRGEDGRYWFYAHLSSYAEGLEPGSSVEAGDRLGLVGNTGYGPPGHEDEFPPHLHFGIRGSVWEDPFPLLRRLYRRATAETARGDRRLLALARAGNRDGFETLSSTLFDPGLSGNILG